MNKKELIEKYANEAYEKGSFNGTWLLAESGNIISKGAVGFRDPEDTLPITEDTIFQLASVSKQFTATAVMLLIREGKLSLQDEITKYFPEIPYPGVTIQHLLTHTGGVPDYFDDEDWFINIWKEEKRVPGNDEILRFLCETEAKPYFAPGENFQYSNTGYNLLALLVELLSETPYEEFLQKNIFDPAGMTSTRCCHIRRDGVPFDNYARATVIEDGKYMADIDSIEYDSVAAFDGLNGDDYVYTNIFDMLKWDRVLREGRILTLEEQQLMYTPVRLNNGNPFVDEDGDSYGFGWAPANNPETGLVVSHSGGMPGVHTWYERFVDADKVLVILCSREEQDARVHSGFFSALRAIARGEDPEPLITIEDIAVKDPDKSQWESFCGKYEHPEDDDFVIDEIFMKDGELYAKVPGYEVTYEYRLYPIGENEFGRKGGMLKLKIGDGCLMFGDITCKKLN